MAWNDLKAAVAAVIKTNGTQAITGELLKSTLNSIIDQVGGSSLYKGIATTTTNPGTPDSGVFYLASDIGVYSNFGGLTITNKGLYVLEYKGSWQLKTALTDLAPAGGSTKSIFDLDLSKLTKQPGKNLLDPSTSEVGKFFFANGIDIGTHSGYAISDYIPVTGNLIMNQVQGEGTGNNVYDINRVRLRSFTSPNYEYQAGDAFVRFTYRTATGCQIETGTVSTAYEPYTFNAALDTRIKKIETSNSNKVNKDIGKNIYDPSRTTRFGYFFLKNGEEGGEGTSILAITDFIAVTGNLIMNQVHEGAWNNVYDINKVRLRSFSSPNYVYQAGDAFVRFSYKPSLPFQIEVGTVSTAYEPYTEYNSIIERLNILENLESYPISLDMLNIENSVGEGCIARKYGIDIPIGATGSESYMQIRLVDPNTPIIGNFKIQYEILTNVPAANFILWEQSVTQKGPGVVLFERTFLNNSTSINSIVFPLAPNNTTDWTMRLSNFKVTPLDYESSLFIQQYVKPQDKKVLEVFKSFTSETEGWGVTRFASIIDAHNAINFSGPNNKFLIRLMPGIYNEFETVWAGTDEESDEGYMGIIVKDHEYFESFDIDLPELTTLKWDGHAGFSDGHVMTVTQCMRRSIFHITKRPCTTEISGFKIDTKNTRFCIHPESASTGAGNNWKLYSLELQWGGRPNCVSEGGTHLGIGISCGETGLVELCKFTGVAGGVDGHNNGWSVVNQGPKPLITPGAKLIFKKCDFNGNDFNMTTYSNAADLPDSLIIEDCGNINIASFGFTHPATVQNWRGHVINSEITTNQL